EAKATFADQDRRDHHHDEDGHRGVVDLRWVVVRQGDTGDAVRDDLSGDVVDVRDEQARRFADTDGGDREVRAAQTERRRADDHRVQRRGEPGDGKGEQRVDVEGLPQGAGDVGA